MARRSEATPGGPAACAHALERLEAHVDGDLDAAAAAAVEAHLERCPACADEHRLAVTVRRELRALPELDAPPAVLREIVTAAERSRFAGPAPLRRRAWSRLAAAALAAVALGAGWWWGTLRPAPPVPPAGADPALVAQATEEARYALAYLARIHRRAGLKLRDDLFVDRLARPAARGLSRSLSPRFETRAGAAEASGQDRS